MTFRWCILLGFALAAGCGSTLLDLHTSASRSMRDATLSYDASTRAACPSASVSTSCAEAYDAQHAFVDAYTNWLVRLRYEAHRDHWSDPQDQAELVAVCASFARYRASRTALQLESTVPQDVAALCLEQP